MIVVCSGFDAAVLDPLGRMMVHSEGYRTMTRLLMDAAADLCGGRLAMSHEGGYCASYVPYCGLAVMEQLSGIRTKIDDPFLANFSGYPGQLVQLHQEAAICCGTAQRSSPLNRRMTFSRMRDTGLS
jgi:hypothetical protein